MEIWSRRRRNYVCSTEEICFQYCDFQLHVLYTTDSYVIVHTASCVCVIDHNAPDSNKAYFKALLCITALWVTISIFIIIIIIYYCYFKAYFNAYFLEVMLRTYCWNSIVTKSVKLFVCQSRHFLQDFREILKETLQNFLKKCEWVMMALAIAVRIHA